MRKGVLLKVGSEYSFFFLIRQLVFLVPGGFQLSKQGANSLSTDIHLVNILYVFSYLLAIAVLVVRTNMPKVMNHEGNYFGSQFLAIALTQIRIIMMNLNF